MRQQCPKMEKGIVDVEMCQEPCTDPRAPTGSLLRWSSQKATRNAIGIIRLQDEEHGGNKSNRQDGAHQRPAVNSL